MAAASAGGLAAGGRSWIAAYGAQRPADQMNAEASSKNPQRRYVEAFAIQPETALRLCRAKFNAA
jgi:hypothetical protein